MEFSLSGNWYHLLIVAVVSYLIGCFNFATVISKFKKRDIRTVGSGNPGTMNMTRTFGLKIGIITFFCDAFKGGIPSLICFFVYRKYIFAGTPVAVADFMRYFSGLCVIIGHIFPVTAHFKGGKGIASTLGLFWINIACENPWFLLIGFAFFWCLAFFIFFTEWGSLGSLIGVTTFGIWQGVIFYNRYSGAFDCAYVWVLFGVLLAFDILTWSAHYMNLYRLLAGEEHRTILNPKHKEK